MNSERRAWQRSATREIVRFELAGLACAGTMRNLSQLGCMIEAVGLSAEIGVRCEVSLLPGYTASGRVAWQLGEAVGISFHQPIPLGLVREFALDDWPLRSRGELESALHSRHRP